MAVLFDNNVLCLLLHPEANVPNDPSTGQPIDRAADRVRFLAETLQERGEIIIIPTPVLAEFLTVASPEYLAILNQSIWFDIADFDQPAAIEAAIALKRDMLPGGAGKRLGLNLTWQEVKVDRHIVAIGKARGVSAVYSTDKGVLAIARACGLNAHSVASLGLPPEDELQLTLADLLATSTEPSSGTAPPSAQSHGGGQEKAPEPEQPRRAIPPDAPKQPPPDSSQTAAPPPRSKK